MLRAKVKECWTVTPVLSHQTTPSPSYGSQPTANRLPLFGSRKHSILSIFLCCAGLLFEALECFLLRSWLSRLLQHPARRAEWAYSYLLPGPTHLGLVRCIRSIFVYVLTIGPTCGRANKQYLPIFMLSGLSCFLVFTKT